MPTKTARLTSTTTIIIKKLKKNLVLIAKAAKNKLSKVASSMVVRFIKVTTHTIF